MYVEMASLLFKLKTLLNLVWFMSRLKVNSDLKSKHILINFSTNQHNEFYIK